MESRRSRQSLPPRRAWWAALPLNRAAPSPPSLHWPRWRVPAHARLPPSQTAPSLRSPRRWVKPLKHRGRQCVRWCLPPRKTSVHPLPGDRRSALPPRRFAAARDAPPAEPSDPRGSLPSPFRARSSCQDSTWFDSGLLSLAFYIALGFLSFSRFLSTYSRARRERLSCNTFTEPGALRSRDP